MLIKILTSKQYKALQEENQRLKEENAELIERAKWNAREQRTHNENMRNENAKLKRLALHAMRDLFCVYMANEYFNTQDRKDEDGKARAKKLYEKFAHLRDKYREAYRKEKAKLKEKIK